MYDKESHISFVALVANRDRSLLSLLQTKFDIRLVCAFVENTIIVAGTV